MRLKRSPIGARMHTLVLFVVLSAIALTASPAFALPPGRTYEMVSPVYKAGYGVIETIAVAPDGESVAFSAKGGFAGLLLGSGIFANEYVAQRGSTGWSTVSVQPPLGSVSDFSAGLEDTLAFAPVGANAGAEESASEEELLLHSNDTPETAENWEVDGGLLLTDFQGARYLRADEAGASSDLCHVVTNPFEGPLLAAAVGTVGQLYEVARGCGGEPPSLRLVSLKNDSPSTVINRKCNVELGATGRQFSAIAADGSEMFFTTNGTGVGSSCSGGAPQLFVRLGGSRTLEVSRPLLPICSEVPCEGAATRAGGSFEGAAEDGSRVFFETTAPLVGEDKDAGNDLYEATIGCPGVEPLSAMQPCEPSQREVTSLVQVSHAPSGEAADVQGGVVRVAPDGSRVYFVALGVLGEGANAQGQTPVRGADNLYVYEHDQQYPSGHIAFVADLCSGPGQSGTAEDLRCPSEFEASGQARNDTRLWGELGGHEAQTAGQDGRFLVFSSYGQLVADDTDNAKDIYRYDAETGALERVSLGEAAYDANGNRNDSTEENADATIESPEESDDKVVEQQEMNRRAISEDGSRIVFSTADPLSPNASDAASGAEDIYEWHEGSVSLISSGESSASQPVITPSGRDIFFDTSQGLVSQDTDGLVDLYDARLEGGFPPPPAPRQQCSSDACQGPLTNPAPLLVAGSAVQAPGENFAAPASKPVVKAKPKSKKKKIKKKKRKAKKSTKGKK